MPALTVSGYLLYHFSNEDIRPVLSIVHWVPGVALALSLPPYVWKGRRQAKMARAKSHLKRAA